MNAKKLRTIFAFLLLFALVLTACGGDQADVEEPPVEESEPAETGDEEPAEVEDGEPAIEVVAVSTDLLLDPALAANADSLMLSSYLFDTLFILVDGQPSPALVREYTISEDQLHYTFELRPNVTFSNGDLLTADIVVANFNRWFDPDDPLHGSQDFAAWKNFFFAFKGELAENGAPLSYFDGVEKTGELTLLVHLNQPAPDLLFSLSETAFSIVNTNVLAEVGDAFGTADGQTVGTGKYVLASWADGKLELAPNANAWSNVPETSLFFEQK